MDNVKLISIDGDVELDVVQNYEGQGRPGFVVSYFDDSGVTQKAKFPVSPEALIHCLRVLQEGEHNMVQALYAHMVSEITEKQIKDLAQRKQMFSVVRND